MKQFYLYADQKSISVLENDSEKILLAGGDFGYGNFGDIAQHINTIGFHQDLGRYRTVSILAANAIGNINMPEFIRNHYNTDAVIFVSENLLNLSDSGVPICQVKMIRNASIFHLYGGGFLNENWGDFVLGVTEFFLQALEIKNYFVSGQQISQLYVKKVIQHIKKYQPFCFAVRDRLSQQWLTKAGFHPEYSFDDATETLFQLSKSLSLRKGNGLFLHLNSSDYTSNDSSMAAELLSLSKHPSTKEAVTLCQAYRDNRLEVVDSQETIKNLDRGFPFSFYQTIELPILLETISSDCTLTLEGELGYSCSYHVALWLQLAGIPCWLRNNNPFYSQKSKALQIDIDFDSFLKAPIATNHRENLEQREQWLSQLHQKILALHDSTNSWHFLPPKRTPDKFVFKAPPNKNDEIYQLRVQNKMLDLQLQEQNNTIHNLRQLSEEICQLRVQNQACSEKITELGASCHKLLQQEETKLQQLKRDLNWQKEQADKNWKEAQQLKRDLNWQKEQTDKYWKEAQELKQSLKSGRKNK